MPDIIVASNPTRQLTFSIHLINNIMNPQTKLTPLEERNRAVIASYLLMTKTTKQLIATLEQEVLRHTLEIDCKDFSGMAPKLHEFISTLLYLCLRDSEKGYIVHFGFDQSNEFTDVTQQFVRLIYRLTMKEVTSVNIEDAVQNHSIITDTSGLIDYMQWKHPSLPMRVIKHKPTNKQKQLLTVA